MSSREETLEQLYASLGLAGHTSWEEGTAHIEIHQNRVLGAHLVPGLAVDADERADGVEARIRVEKGAALEKPVQICFGVLPESGRQHIVLDVAMEENASASFIAYCTFPNARRVVHEMDAKLRIAPGARYEYFERHVHGPGGGVRVIPKAEIEVGEGARFKTEFELVKGRVGEMEIDYLITAGARSVAEMVARVRGRGDDRISIRETAHLVGEGARGALTSHLALRDTARAEIYNEIRASAPYARGHVDCKEIIQGEAVARAVPVVEVSHPRAHVTHEAALGSVDTKQLETLMSRGLDEDEASELIIQGMLS